MKQLIDLDSHHLLPDLRGSYDDEGDVLYMSFGEPKPCISHEISYNVLFREAVDGSGLNGITILNFKDRIKGGVF